MNTLLVILGSAAAGLGIGCFYGFCLAGHMAAINGYLAPEDRPILRLLTSVNANLTIAGAAAFLALAALALVGLFVCVGLPAVLSSRFAPDAPLALPAAYAALMALGGLGRVFGRHVWSVVS